MQVTINQCTDAAQLAVVLGRAWPCRIEARDTHVFAADVFEAEARFGTIVTGLARTCAAEALAATAGDAARAAVPRVARRVDAGVVADLRPDGCAPAVAISAIGAPRAVTVAAARLARDALALAPTLLAFAFLLSVDVFSPAGEQERGKTRAEAARDSRSSRCDGGDRSRERVEMISVHDDASLMLDVRRRWTSVHYREVRRHRQRPIARVGANDGHRRAASGDWREQSAARADDDHIARARADAVRGIGHP
jgi:hypothetical protein